MTVPMQTLARLPEGTVRLLPSLFQRRFDLNRNYVASLKTQNLLQNHYFEAAIWAPPGRIEDIHWGWESPNSMVRGHFVGHWLSAASRIAVVAGDDVLRARAHEVVAELARCQEVNGGEWVFSIPEKYLHWIAKGRTIWAPSYICHKTMMGLFDAHKLLGSELALEVMTNAARWFHRWASSFTREQRDDIFDYELGGMLEMWADLFGVTGDPTHRELIELFDRPRLYEPLLRGEDVLTNQHANTTIPEVQGAARAYEVTGDERYRRIVEEYWRLAVTERGAYCTGGQTCGELWTPPFELAARRGPTNQEHCTVYNMMRLAEYLFRWTGDPTYADYWERNLYNGILAQQHPTSGMVSYYLGLQAGSKKGWCTPTESFFCCTATLVQAQSSYAKDVYYLDATNENVVVAQYVPSTATLTSGSGDDLRITQQFEGLALANGKANYTEPGPTHRPQAMVVELHVESDSDAERTISLRLPSWVSGPVRLDIDGQPDEVMTAAGGFHRITRPWSDNRIRLELPRQIVAEPLPDEPGTVAFLEGPVVLAGLCDEERAIVGDAGKPESFLKNDYERHLGQWSTGYRTVGQQVSTRFVPLYEVADEAFTVYFPVQPA